MYTHLGEVRRQLEESVPSIIGPRMEPRQSCCPFYFCFSEGLELEGPLLQSPESHNIVPTLGGRMAQREHGVSRAEAEPRHLLPRPRLTRSAGFQFYLTSILEKEAG